jgi:hypothetical protein
MPEPTERPHAATNDQLGERSLEDRLAHLDAAFAITDPLDDPENDTYFDRVFHGGPHYVPPMPRNEVRDRNARLVALLNQWESEGDEQEQRETLDVIRKALGPDRVASSRAIL